SRRLAELGGDYNVTGLNEVRMLDEQLGEAGVFREQFAREFRKTCQPTLLCSQVPTRKLLFHSEQGVGDLARLFLRGRGGKAAQDRQVVEVERRMRLLRDLREHFVHRGRVVGLPHREQARGFHILALVGGGEPVEHVLGGRVGNQAGERWVLESG